MPPVAAAVIAHPFITAAAVSMVAATGAQISQQSQAAKQAKSAAAAADSKQQQAVKDLQTAQSAASSQAQAAIDARRKRMTSSQTIFTSPLGVSNLASTAKKSLLGQ